MKCSLVPGHEVELPYSNIKKGFTCLVCAESLSTVLKSVNLTDSAAFIITFVRFVSEFLIHVAEMYLYMLQQASIYCLATAQYFVFCAFIYKKKLKQET